jgi:hypothetical protein
MKWGELPKCPYEGYEVVTNKLNQLENYLNALMKGKNGSIKGLIFNI